jgi:isocitrate dehydrogenase
MENGIISYSDKKLTVPDKPVILYIEGDGIGPELWQATRPVLDSAVHKAYNGSREIEWKETLAGGKAFEMTGDYLPAETIAMIEKYRVAIKGPLMTPVGGGIRSINVALRQKFKLYACIRPVKYFRGVPSPVKRPDAVDMIIFRENMEDLYSGIEWKSGTEDSAKILSFLKDKMSINLPADSGIGVKPISEGHTKNIVRKAMEYAIEHHRKSVTIMHKGNIMKFTEGAFRDWAYEVALGEYREHVVTEKELNAGADSSGKVIVRDRIADNMFQEIIIKPAIHDVIIAPNLNGDYISDALAALVGGLGIAPGANIGDDYAIFEATHGTAPDIAGKDMGNPGSLILSGEMLLRFLGWDKAAELVLSAFEKTISEGRVTGDLAAQMSGVKSLSCSEFSKAVIENIG